MFKLYVHRSPYMSTVHSDTQFSHEFHHFSKVLESDIFIIFIS